VKRLVLLFLLDATVASAVEGGAEDTTTTHAVVIATSAPSSPRVRCSGTLISPNVVLTVRHCIAALPSDGASCEKAFPDPAGSPSDFWVSAAPWSLPSTGWNNVASWVVPDAPSVCGNDVALLVLTRPFEEHEAMPATPILTSARFEEAVKGRLFGLAGFGASSASAADTGTRRSRFDMPVRCVPGVPGFPCEGALAYVDPREFTGGAGPCIGDSGAGAILPGDRTTIFGVLARGNFETGTCSEGIYERTDPWAWLIAKTVLTSSSPTPWAKELFPDSPKPGDLCLGEGTCGDAQCVSFDGRRSFVCAKRCSAGCGANEHCESNICAPGAAPSADGGGCAVRDRRGRASGAWSTAAVLAAVTSMTLLRRRRGSRMVGQRLTRSAQVEG
jgi:hypothetical protein